MFNTSLSGLREHMLSNMLNTRVDNDGLTCDSLRRLAIPGSIAIALRAKVLFCSILWMEISVPLVDPVFAVPRRLLLTSVSTAAWGSNARSQDTTMIRSSTEPT